MKVVSKLFAGFRNPLGRFMQLCAALLAISAMTGVCKADDQITTTIAAISGYQTAAVVVGVAVLLFVIGRKVVRKLI